MFSPTHRHLNEMNPRGLSRPELVDAIEQLHRLEAHAVERRMAYTAAIDELGDRGSDAESVTRAVTRRSARDAKRESVAATQLAKMPDTAAALARGDICPEHVHAATIAAERVSAEAADSLAPLAATMPADLFAKKAREWTSRHELPEAIEDRYQQQRARREGRAWTGPIDGMTHLHASFDGAAGRDVIVSVEEVVERLWRTDGGRERSPDDVRTHDQRLCDALYELITGRPALSTTSDAAEPSAHTPPPPVKTPRGRTHPKHMVIVHLDAASGEAQFSDGQPVPPSGLTELGPKAEVVGVVFGSTGQVLHLGRSTRLADRAQWTALIARDHGCTRCGAPPSRCHAHHQSEWSDGGPTDINNLELVCHRDHATIHKRHPTPGPAQARAPAA